MSTAFILSKVISYSLTHRFLTHTIPISKLLQNLPTAICHKTFSLTPIPRLTYSLLTPTFLITPRIHRITFHCQNIDFIALLLSHIRVFVPYVTVSTITLSYSFLLRTQTYTPNNASLLLYTQSFQSLIYPHLHVLFQASCPTKTTT